MELTDTAIVHATKRTGGENPQFIRVGVTGGGCVGYEYYIEYATEIANSDKITDYGQFKVVVDIDSQPFLEEATLDYTKEGINEFFKIVNPKETATCGCGVSIGFA